MKEAFQAFAVAIATANGHPDPHGYADTVLGHMENPPTKPEPAPEPEPVETAPADEPAADAPADPQ